MSKRALTTVAKQGTSNFLSKNNKFSNDIKPLPLEKKSKYHKHKKTMMVGNDERNIMKFTKEPMVNLKCVDGSFPCQPMGPSTAKITTQFFSVKGRIP
jgi:hypothetical protein